MPSEGAVVLSSIDEGSVRTSQSPTNDTTVLAESNNTNAEGAPITKCVVEDVQNLRPVLQQRATGFANYVDTLGDAVQSITEKLAVESKDVGGNILENIVETVDTATHQMAGALHGIEEAVTKTFTIDGSFVNDVISGDPENPPPVSTSSPMDSSSSVNTTSSPIDSDSQHSSDSNTSEATDSLTGGKFSFTRAKDLPLDLPTAKFSVLSSTGAEAEVEAQEVGAGVGPTGKFSYSATNTSTAVEDDVIIPPNELAKLSDGNVASTNGGTGVVGGKYAFTHTNDGVYEENNDHFTDDDNNVANSQNDSADTTTDTSVIDSTVTTSELQTTTTQNTLDNNTRETAQEAVERESEAKQQSDGVGVDEEMNGGVNEAVDEGVGLADHVDANVAQIDDVKLSKNVSVLHKAPIVTLSSSSSSSSSSFSSSSSSSSAPSSTSAPVSSALSTTATIAYVKETPMELPSSSLTSSPATLTGALGEEVSMDFLPRYVHGNRDNAQFLHPQHTDSLTTTSTEPTLHASDDIITALDSPMLVSSLAAPGITSALSRMHFHTPQRPTASLADARVSTRSDVAPSTPDPGATPVVSASPLAVAQLLSPMLSSQPSQMSSYGEPGRHTTDDDDDMGVSEGSELMDEEEIERSEFPDEFDCDISVKMQRNSFGSRGSGGSTPSGYNTSFNSGYGSASHRGSVSSINGDLSQFGHTPTKSHAASFRSSRRASTRGVNEFGVLLDLSSGPVDLPKDPEAEVLVLDGDTVIARGPATTTYSEFTEWEGSMWDEDGEEDDVVEEEFDELAMGPMQFDNRSFSEFTIYAESNVSAPSVKNVKVKEVKQSKQDKDHKKSNTPTVVTARTSATHIPEGGVSVAQGGMGVGLGLSYTEDGSLLESSPDLPNPTRKDKDGVRVGEDGREERCCQECAIM